MLGGRPLIAWTIEAAHHAHSLDYVLVSTDDAEIAEVSRSCGANVPFKRPPEISIDCDTSKVLQHALAWFEETKKQEVSHLACLQPTSPLRTSDDIDRCVQLAKATKADTVISVCHARQHPYWCFQLEPVSQKLTSFMDVSLKGQNLVWQHLPPCVYPNGAVYVTKRDLIADECRIYGDVIHADLMPTERSWDLEEELDFFIASALLDAYGHGEKHVWMKQSWSD